MAVNQEPQKDISGIPVVIGNRPPSDVNSGTFARSHNLINVHHMKWEFPSILLTNARSISNKLDDLQVVAENNGVDIMCITESWLNDDIPDDPLCIPHFIGPFRNDRKERLGGGVLVYVKNSIKVNHCAELQSNDHESIWVTLHPNKLPRSVSSIAIGVIYHPPGANNYNLYNHICHSVDTILKKHPNAGIVILGDFNSFKENSMRNLYDLKQIVKSNTRGNKILDKIFTNLDQFYNEPKILPPLGRSDHSVITCYPNIQSSYIKPHNKTVSYRSNDFTSKVFLVHELKEYNWTTLYELNTCEDKFNMFMSVITDLLDKHLPYKEFIKNTSDKPWVTNDYKSLIIKRQVAWKNKNKHLYNTYRNKVNRATKTIRNKFYKSQVSDLRNTNSSMWWKKTKNVVGLGKSSNSLDHLSNSVCDGDNTKFVNEANKFLASVSHHISPIDMTKIPPKASDFSDMYVITKESVEEKLAKINLKKSTGPDDIPNWLICDMAPILSGPITSIFNSSIKEGYVPTIWRCANVSVLPKTSIPTTIENDLRPISLTPVLSKILESYISNWLWDHLKDKLAKNQYGGIKTLSTVDALIHMVHQWQEAIHNHNSARVLLLDFRKAFDLVDHNILVEKLVYFNVPNILIRWIAHFLCHRKIRVKLQNDVSEWLDINASVPQGSTLGPLLFIIMIDDLQVSTGSSIFKFMDDSTISEILAQGTVSEMNTNMNEVTQWSTKNNMMINFVKTKDMVISSSNNVPITDPIIVGECEIERVNCHKLLGLNISSDLKWDEHINDICKKANKRLYYLVLLRRAGLEEKDLLIYYKQIIRPIMEYACQVWHSNLPEYLSNKLQSIQDRALKIISRNINHINLPSLHERRTNLCKNYFNKLKNENHVLHELLPEKVNHSYNTRFKHQFQLPLCRTEQFKNSFINFSLFNHQSSQ